jgi:Lhr-like helicase
MSLFNPYVLLGIVLTVLGSFGAGYYSGEQNEYERQQLEIARLNEQARETEQRMGEVAQTYAQTLRKANNVAKAKETKLRTDIASGERKLFIPVKTSCPVSAAADSTSVAGDSRETRTELDRSVAEALIAITADGDQAIRKLNACIDQYETLRKMK